MDSATAAFLTFTMIFGCAIPLAIIIAQHLEKKGKLRVMEKAIEKELPLEGLSLENERGPRVPYRTGMIVLAIGIGIGIGAVFVENMTELGLGVASILSLIGLALIINDKMNYDRLYGKSSDLQ